MQVFVSILSRSEGSIIKQYEEAFLTWELNLLYLEAYEESQSKRLRKNWRKRSDDGFGTGAKRFQVQPIS